MIFYIFLCESPKKCLISAAKMTSKINIQSIILFLRPSRINRTFSKKIILLNLQVISLLKLLKSLNWRKEFVIFSVLNDFGQFFFVHSIELKIVFWFFIFLYVKVQKSPKFQRLKWHSNWNLYLQKYHHHSAISLHFFKFWYLS